MDSTKWTPLNGPLQLSSVVPPSSKLCLKHNGLLTLGQPNI